MMWVILQNWKTFLLAGLAACLALSLILLNRAWTEVAVKTAEITSMRNAAIQYRDKSNQTAQEVSDGYQALVEQIKEKDIALINARKRFGNAACGLTPHRLPTQHGSGQTDSTPSVDATEPERVAVGREFIDACATDAARLIAWRSWAVKNELPISKE
jgi:hypothetical protein